MSNDQLDNQFDDLKQFIDSRISQSEERTGKRIDEIDEKIDQLRQETREGFAGVADAIEHQNTEFDQRITRLEEKAA